MNRVTLSNSINSSCFPPLATYWKHLRFVLDMTTSTPFDKGTICGFEWALEALHHHPSIKAGVCEEVERNLGSRSHIEDSDLAKLPYLQAVVKELFRLYPPCAFSFPHESSDEYCHIFGYEVSPRTQVLINIYTIQRDHAVWTNPDEFNPTRFINHAGIDMYGQHYQLLPFGGGRRQCPATKLAIRYVQSGLARYFHDARSSRRIPHSTF
jgi:cytochrome P450